MKVWCLFEVDEFNNDNKKTLFSVRSTKEAAQAEVDEMGWPESSYEIREWQVD